VVLNRAGGIGPDNQLVGTAVLLGEIEMKRTGIILAGAFAWDWLSYIREATSQLRRSLPAPQRRMNKQPFSTSKT